MNKNLLISGWFNYTHSICMVNLEHLKCFRNLDLNVHTDERAPLFHNWINSRKDNSLSKDIYYKSCISGTSPASSFANYDALIDIAVPPCIPHFKADKKAIFMVSETDMLTKTYLQICGGINNLKQMHSSCDFVFTPSEWSRQSLINSGLTSNKILVIPHGINYSDSVTSDQKNNIQTKMRTKLGIPKDKIVILHIGAMTKNKGIDVLIKAIAYSKFRKDIVLVLKGNDLIFDSNKFVQDTIGYCKKQGAPLPTIKYIGMNLTKSNLNNLMLSCDLYASLFRSEGFNLPVAEAINNQKSVLATKAPPVTEYMHQSNSTYYVDARQVLNPENNKIRYFEPILESCIEQINCFVSNYKVSNLVTHNSSLTTWEHNTNILASHLGLS